MLQELLIIAPIFNLVSSAILSSQARPPKDPSSTYFSALLYSRDPPTFLVPYGPVTVYCTAVLIAPNWLLTSQNCRVRLKWKILIGVPRVPVSAILKWNTYKIKRFIQSLENLLTLIQMDRNIEVSTIHPIKIGSFKSNTKCIVSTWMNDIESPTLRKLSTAREQLHCHFKAKNSSACRTIIQQDNVEVGMDKEDICLLHTLENDPVALCENDIGAPVICDGYLIAVVYFIPNIGERNSGDCIAGKTGRFYPAASVYPMNDWIGYFIHRSTNLASRNFNFIDSVYFYLIYIILIH